MARALRRGEPVDLCLGALPTRALAAEVFPLCRSVDVGGAALPAQWAQLLAPRGRPEHRSGPPVTVLVPTHRRWPASLGALHRQSHPLELRVLSNGAGPQWLPGARVERVVWQGHGATRQAALERVATPYVLFMSDDACPLGDGWLATLVAALEAGHWDAVVARQVPWPDAPRATRERVRQWTPWSPEVLPIAQADHVATLHRTALLRRAPLPPVDIAEDLVWSQGRRVGLVSAAPVLHSHGPQVRASYRRARAEHAVRAGHGLPTPGKEAAAVVQGMLAAPRRLLRDGPRVAAAELAELLGQWSGPRGVS
jgi:hypothetical protein